MVNEITITANRRLSLAKFYVFYVYSRGRHLKHMTFDEAPNFEIGNKDHLIWKKSFENGY